MARLSYLEMFGLYPPRQRLAEFWLGLRGDDQTPATRWDVSSLKLFRLRISLPTWLGIRRRDRLVPIYNFFNRTPTPPEEGWSVRVTQVRDFRGGTLTYDSHNGTDFAIPVGTTTTSPSDGRVMRVSSEFNRGGLKIFIDHGHGIVTSSNHMGRSFVAVGDIVRRGDEIGLSGASGMDMLLFSPWVAPHVHFNVFLNGRHIDPFAEVGSTEESLWLGGGDPLPPTGDEENLYETSQWDEANMAQIVSGCTVPKLKRELERIDDADTLAGQLLFQTTYYPTRFQERPSIYAEVHPRRPLISLPFSKDDFDGVHY
jgi:murein DD-endopeptidase